MSFVTAIEGVLDGARNLLTGEPARVIGYGAAVVVYLVGKAVGTLPDQTFDEAILSAGAALAVIASVIETIRRYVYSPNSVAAIVLSPPTGTGPIEAAVEAGVDVGVDLT